MDEIPLGTKVNWRCSLQNFVFDNMSTGYFKAGDVNHFSEVLRRKFGELALHPRIAYDMTKYKWDTIAEQTVEVYESIL